MNEQPILGFTGTEETANIIQRPVWNTYGIGVSSRPAQKGDMSIVGEKAVREDQRAIVVGLHLASETNLKPDQYTEVAAFINGIQMGMVAQIVKNINEKVFPESSPLES